MKTFLTLLLCSILAGAAHAQLSQEELDQKVKATVVAKLPYSIDQIVVRGFDGDNPPPRLETPMRNMFYGYGMTAYIQTHDTLIFFTIEHLEAKHKDASGKVLLQSNETGSRYTDMFKRYFTEVISRDEWKNIYFENIYLKDKKGNFIKITKPMKFCPHCK